MKYILLVLSVFTVFAFCMSSDAEAQQIVFTSNRDGNNEIYVMSADGSNQTRITNNSYNDSVPSWSPDGSKIVFTSNRDGNYEIYIMNADGTNQTRLTDYPSEDNVPSWSPDGSKIAFYTNRDGGGDQIYVMNADGSNQTRLTLSAGNYASSWSPDGSKITFHSNRDGNNEVYIMNADGSNQTRLTNNSANDYYSSWSPDGSQIVFQSDRDGSFEIYSMLPDGTNQTNLTNNSSIDDFGFWSPDGTQISFTSDRDGNKEIYLMSSDGTNQTRLTNNSAVDYYPSWKPTSTSTITLNSPNGSESWEASTTQNITWTSSNVTNVKLEYTTDNGSSWTDIVASTAASAGTYAWTVPIRPSTNCKVRVSDASDAGVNDSSNAVFTITESTGETILFASQRDGNTEVYVMNANGTNQTRLIYNSAEDYNATWSPDGSKIAFESNRDGNQEIYVMDADGSNTTRLTNNSGIDWNPSWKHNGTKIVFTSSRDGNYEIYIMDADGSNQTNISNNSANDYYPSWSPDGSKIAFRTDRNGNHEIYVMDAGGSNQTNITNNSANDVYPYWSPDGSKIAFTSDRDGNWEIYLMNSDGSNQINLTNNSASENLSLWSPDGLKIAFTTNRDGNSEIYVMNADGSNQTNISNNSAYDGYHSWARPVYHEMTSLTLTSPNGGENWTAGTSHNISWTSSNVTDVKLEYSTNGGSSWNTIVSSHPANSYSYNWAVPNVQSSNCLLKITDTGDPAVTDQSNGTFTIIQPTITVSSPNGGENWTAGTSHNITWTSSNVTDVKLEYSTNSGSSWNFLHQMPSSGSYLWVVPNMPSQNCLIKISDLVDPTVTDQSDAVFTIASAVSLTLTSPNGGESWEASTQQNITWTHVNMDRVMIQFSSDDGESWDIIVENYDANAGSFSWTVPNINSSECLIKISDDFDTDVTDQSDEEFTIASAGSLILTSPNGGETWLSETNRAITWTSTDISTINIHYTMDGGSVYHWIAEDVDASTGSYWWSVPGIASAGCKVWIYDSSDMDVTDTSQDFFTIGAPEIRLSPESVDVGDVDVGSSGTGFFSVYNDGNIPLTVTRISSDNSRFDVSTGAFTLQPGNNVQVEVTFNPTNMGEHSANIAVYSNDTGESTLTVYVR
ncbi:MAG: DUF5050 domain-containing protein, partial [Candidatus Latescibacteria bacterium]|nr:DUF5050 domain-containing protein [Candidatus Latescibacterota bacterium]